MEANRFEPLRPGKKHCDWKTFTDSICAFPVRYFSLWRWGAGIQMRAPFPFHDPTSHHWKIATLLRQFFFGVASTDWLVQSTWCDLTEYTFIIIPKTGDELGPTSWRPIAIPIATLQITGKIPTKLLHQCLKECFESSQSHDQLGFKPGMGVEHALLIFESVTEKSLEFGFGLWMATLHLRKGFDILQLCSQHSTDKGLLKQRHSAMNFASWFGIWQCVKSDTFPINRGVNQGDVLSLALFKARLENPMSAWKQRLGCLGVDQHRITVPPSFATQKRKGRAFSCHQSPAPEIETQHICCGNFGKGWRWTSVHANAARPD